MTDNNNNNKSDIEIRRIKFLSLIELHIIFTVINLNYIDANKENKIGNVVSSFTVL